MANFTGLRANAIFGGLYNMIISQHVYGDNIKGTYSRLVDMARVDGSMYGDQKLYYATDVLKSHAWGNDAEAANLLALDRPAAPACQAIVLDKFRQIRLTVDNYLTKQAWMNEGAFTSFNSIMLGWMRDTKRVFDSLTYNTFIGTNETTIGEQDMTIAVVAGQNDALTMAEALANLLVNLKDVSRDYNDYGYLRSYDESDFIVVWNAKHYNQLKKIDMPVIFHKEGLLNEFTQEVLPERYFGTVVGTTHSTIFQVPATDEYRALVERDITLSNNTPKHVFPGDLLPSGSLIPEDEVYKVDDTIAFKCYYKGAVPFMSAFEVGTSFFNPRSLTENHYLTWGYNTLEHLKNYPFITARFAAASQGA